MAFRRSLDTVKGTVLRKTATWIFAKNFGRFYIFLKLIKSATNKKLDADPYKKVPLSTVYHDSNDSKAWRINMQKN
jgi:hypothetical protein